MRFYPWGNWFAFDIDWRWLNFGVHRFFNHWGLQATGFSVDLPIVFHHEFFQIFCYLLVFVKNYNTLNLFSWFDFFSRMQDSKFLCKVLLNYWKKKFKRVRFYSVFLQLWWSLTLKLMNSQIKSLQFLKFYLLGIKTFFSNLAEHCWRACSSSFFASLRVSMSLKNQCWMRSAEWFSCQMLSLNFLNSRCFFIKYSSIASVVTSACILQDPNSISGFSEVAVIVCYGNWL